MPLNNILRNMATPLLNEKLLWRTIYVLKHFNVKLVLVYHFGLEHQLSLHTFPSYILSQEASRNSAALRASQQDLPASFGKHPQPTLSRVHDRFIIWSKLSFLLYSVIVIYTFQLFPYLFLKCMQLTCTSANIYTCPWGLPLVSCLFQKGTVGPAPFSCMGMSGRGRLWRSKFRLWSPSRLYHLLALGL